MSDRINIKFEYIDKDYGSQYSDDSVTVSFPANVDLHLLNKTFADFTENYMRGYELGDELDACETEEEYLTFESDNGISRKDALKFANLREEGLSGSLVVSSFLDEHPEFGGNIIENNCYYISFNEYDGCDIIFDNDLEEDTDLEL